MSDFVGLISRVLLSAVFILYGYFKLVDVTSILNNPGTKRFMDLVAAGTPTPVTTMAGAGAATALPATIKERFHEQWPAFNFIK